MRLIYLISLSALLLSGGCSKEDPETAPKPVQENRAPETPMLVRPVENESCTSTNLTFEWKAAEDPDGDNVSYQLEVSQNQNFSGSVQARQTGTLTAVLNLDPGVTYYWRAKAIDTRYTSSSYSGVRKFYTEPKLPSNGIPYQPEVVFPGNNSVVDGDKILLKWNARDPDGDELLYDLYFANQNPPQLIKDNHPTTSLEVTIESNSTYYWKIVAKDPHGAKAIGEVWSFKVR
ncbi:hypothetical protein BH23BAC2_BH23BAC2_22480 [soil metagenome]